MWINRIKSTLISSRIDSEYYDPIVYDHLSKLDHWKPQPMRNFVTDIRSEPPIHTSHYSEDGIHIISPTNFTDFQIDFSATKKISYRYTQLFADFVLQPGRLIYALVGDVGHACVVPKSPPLAISYRRTANVKLEGINPYFVCAFLNIPIGYLQFKRMTTGVIQDQLRLEDSAAILLPTIKSSSQTYIGDKVRQAERLRARARELEEKFQNLIRQNYEGIFDTPISGKHYRARTLELNRNLNPGAFNPERIRLQNYIMTQGGRLLKEVASVGAATTENYSSTSLYFGLDSFDSSSSRLTPSTVAQAEVTGVCRLIKEGPVISKLRPYLNKVGYIPNEFAGAVGSTELFQIQPKGDFSGWYIYGTLKLGSTIRQLNPVSTGSTHPRVTREDIEELYIPWSDDTENAGNLLEFSQDLYFSSERLTTAAKLLVEALIEGQVSESDLVAAQKALEAGDRSVDREILRRLTRKGLDAPGEPPLFTDLDELYEALDGLDVAKEKTA